MATSCSVIKAYEELSMSRFMTFSFFSKVKAHYSE